MIWIIGGTSETNRLLKLLGPEQESIVTVATETGAAFIKNRQPVVGRMDQKQMTAFIKKQDIYVIVDLSHPYAIEVTKNAKQAAESTGTKYIRYLRSTTDTTDTKTLTSLNQCLSFLKIITGTVFFTTGSKHISEFQAVRGNNRFIYRILPAPESLAICRNNHVDMKDIVAILGPFSQEMNQVMFQEYKADYVIMKNSGNPGGTDEKIKACRQLGITPVIIERPPEEGFNDLQSLAEFLQQIH